MTLKESTQTAGLPQSAGIEPLKDYRPASDGPIARCVFAAGACLLGKTNIPVALGDWQADSPVYGRTNNPWDLERTPGGSTGGGAAALAAGMTPLEIGSDIGGSIRVPAAYCGLYGHRPSRDSSSPRGAVPVRRRREPGGRDGSAGTAGAQRGRHRAAVRRRRRSRCRRSRRRGAWIFHRRGASDCRIFACRDHAEARPRAAIGGDAGEGRRAGACSSRRLAQRSARRCPTSTASATSTTT